MPASSCDRLDGETGLRNDPHFRAIGSLRTGLRRRRRRSSPGREAAIVDVQLPELPGDELCHGVQRLLPESSVVVLSANP